MIFCEARIGRQAKGLFAAIQKEIQKELAHGKQDVDRVGGNVALRTAPSAPEGGLGPACALFGVGWAGDFPGLAGLHQQEALRTKEGR